MAEPLPLDGAFVGSAFHLPVRVYFEDTDLSGIVYHANYLRFMERARSSMLRAAGIDQRATHEAGEGAYAVRDVSLRYRAPAKLDDLLTIVTRLVAIRAASVVIHQTVMREALSLCDARVEAAFVAPNGRPRRQPAAWVAVFRPLLTNPEREPEWN
jgi:acyl-CoA thioester hydrolase